MSEVIRPTTWTGFWMHVDAGWHARFDEVTSAATITRDDVAGKYHLSFSSELPAGDGNYEEHSYGRKTLQDWLDDKFEPNDWALSEE